MIRSRVITPASESVIDVSTARGFLKISYDHEDALLAVLITTAQELVENYLNRKLLPTTIEVLYDRDDLKTLICLPFPPVISVNSITWYDSDGDAHEMVEGTDYELFLSGTPARVRFLNRASYRERECVVINQTVGWNTSADVPRPIVLAVLHLVAHLYELRQPIVDTRMVALPFTAHALLHSYRYFSE